MRTTSLVLLSAVASVACTVPVTTIPYPVSTAAAIQRNDLELPPDLEVRSASYSVTGLPDVGGMRGNTSSNVQIRPLLTVYAVRRSTGEQLVLVYEDLSQRKQPSQIIRLVPGSDSSSRKGRER